LPETTENAEIHLSFSIFSTYQCLSGSKEDSYYYSPPNLNAPACGTPIYKDWLIVYYFKEIIPDQPPYLARLFRELKLATESEE
jgi:hypothetical protein